MELSEHDAQKTYICPLKMICGYQFHLQSLCCEKEDCAWYSKYTNECSVLGIMDVICGCNREETQWH